MNRITWPLGVLKNMVNSGLNEILIAIYWNQWGNHKLSLDKGTNEKRCETYVHVEVKGLPSLWW